MQGRTPLHLAAYENDSETVELLIRFGADATATDDQVCCFCGKTSQHWFFCKDWHGHPSLASTAVGFVTSACCHLQHLVLPWC